MAIKINDIIISTDDTLEYLENFSILKNVIKTLIDSSLLQRMSGNCIGACEIIGNMLYQKGIKSYMIETQLTLASSEGDTTLIGYDNFLSPEKDYSSQIDTHTVLIITMGDTQLLLDPSIQYVLPPTHPIVLERINGESPEIVSEYKYNHSHLVYTSKAVSKLPFLTQQNLLSSVLSESKNSKKLYKYAYVLYIVAGISILNMIFNILLLIIK
jgi:hypothetical protein